MSVQNAVVSEYTSMAFLETQKGANKKQQVRFIYLWPFFVRMEIIYALWFATILMMFKQASRKVDKNNKTEDSKPQRISVLHNLGIGFGNLSATADNFVPGSKDTKPPDAAEAFVKAASVCCGFLCNNCCCMGCIKCCSKMNDQCVTAFAQLCGAFACLGCYACCCDGQEGWERETEYSDVVRRFFLAQIFQLYPMWINYYVLTYIYPMMYNDRIVHYTYWILSNFSTT